jgi:hypothetical protein
MRSVIYREPHIMPLNRYSVNYLDPKGIAKVANYRRIGEARACMLRLTAWGCSLIRLELTR